MGKKKITYRVEEDTAGHGMYARPRFAIICEGRLICEMTSSTLMEGQVRKEFELIANFLNQKP